MTIIKRIAALALFAALLLSSAACGEYKPAIDSGIGDNQYPGDSAQQPDLDDDPTNDFTVQLRLNGETYVPTHSMSVYWRDGYSIHIAPVDSTGVARIDGLDGDYNVTLSNVPQDCAYDPNAYMATNDNRNITIDMYDLNMVQGAGTELYSCYSMTGTGVYSVTVTEPGELTYFEFSPQTSGTYTVESWADVNDDGVNPKVVAYYGTSSYKHSPYTIDDGGVCGSYTRNFVHTIEIADEMISNAGGGSQSFTFAVTAEVKSGIYPVTVTFAIKRDGGFDLNRVNRTMMKMEADLSHFDIGAFRKLAGGKIVGAETLYPGTTNSYMFDEDNYKIWKVSQGGDGMYHVYDPVKYAATDGYGPVLVAYITEPCRFLDVAFTEIESKGNKALTVSGGSENYKQFIEGFEAVASGGYYCLFTCACHKSDDPNKACVPGCQTCSSNCTPCPADLMGKPGYAAWANDDGVVPVTEELADFLQKFAISQRYFADGDGWVESNGSLNIDAYEDSQWLFACGYYVS